MIGRAFFHSVGHPRDGGQLCVVVWDAAVLPVVHNQNQIRLQHAAKSQQQWKWVEITDALVRDRLE